MPHGHCYLWLPALIWLHFVSDGLIFLAYLSIPFTLIHIVRRRQDLPFNWIFMCFGAFIIACGATHLMEIWNLWHGAYWSAGAIKAVTALFSVLTAVLLVQLVPKALAMPSRHDLELALRKVAEAELRTAAEITRQQDAREIRLLMDRYRSLVLASGQVIWTNSPEGEMRGEQPGWAELTGQTFEQYQRFGWADALHPDDRDRTVKEWEQAVDERRLFAIEHRVRRHDGEYRDFLVRAVPVLDPDGAIREWVGSHTDITEHRLAEEELRRAKDAAETANRTKSLFLANMSHELRTPLNAVIGYSEILQEEVQELGVGKLVPDLQKIHAAGKHLLALINDVLDLSKIEAGKMDLYLESFDVVTALREIVGTINPLAEKNDNTLTLEIDDAGGRPGSLGVMHADLTKVRQSLFNLLSNASKFTKGGRITLKAGREQLDGRAFLYFSVRDTGIGMSPEQLARLFSAFSQADASTTRRFGGTGLGLALSRRFCQMMGGDITVESAPGHGTTFTIKLPVRASPKETPPPAPDPAPIDALDPAADPSLVARVPVLVIDDDQDTRDLMRRYLAREGFRAAVATSGEEGLRLARELRPAVITLDVVMPGMDGWAVLAAIKADPLLQDTPVVMITMVSDHNLGYSLGAAEYLTKPVERDRLSSLLRKYHCQDPPCAVLVVEDDESSRQLMRAMLEREGWAVIEAQNGQEALQRLVLKRPELILLDLMMPEMDGFQLAAAINKNPEWRAIPIVVLTAKDVTPEDRLRLNGYVQKILRKGAQTREEIMREVRDLVAYKMKTKEE